ncbi:MAG: hypothetical protein ACRESP_09250, partial [Pseudomonas sp.]
MTDRLTLSDNADDAAAEQRLMDERRLSELQQLKADLEAQKASATQAVAAESAALDTHTAAAARGGTKRHIAHDSTEWKAISSLPDFCRVGSVVVAFDSFATLDKPVLASSDVKARGSRVYRQGDLFQQVQANAGAHVISGTSLGSGYVKLLEGHDNVKVNGLPLARHDSACLINCNAAGVGGTLGKIVTAAQPATPVPVESSDLAPPGERSSARLKALEAEREALKQHPLNIDQLDKYIDFDSWNKKADEHIASLQQGGILSGIPAIAVAEQFLPKVAEVNAQVTRGVAGFVKDTVLGAAELGYNVSKAHIVNQGLLPNDTALRKVNAQILAENMRLGNITPGTLSEDLKAMAAALLKPVTQPWVKGDYIESITRAGAEVLTLPWELLKAGHAAQAAKAASALKNANRAEPLTHVDDGIHVTPQGAPRGSAE